MSTVAAKKPPASSVGGRASSVDPNPASAPGTPPARSAHRPSPSTTSPGPGGVARNRSIRTGNPVSARASAPRKDSPLSNTSDADEAARAETVALLDDLKDRLAKAESSSEQYRKQTEVLQSRLDEALEESTKLEEKNHEYEEQTETLKNEKRDVARQLREMESIYEAERSSMTKEKEDMSNREEEMQMVIQRLKDSLAQRNHDDDGRPSRQPHSPSVEGGFAPPSSLNRSDSRNNSKLLLQKDKLIESLRLELAEAQIKLVESENSGGGRLHEVEKLLMEARMANARLMEDNESYQLLLQEKTLNGDFTKSDFSYMASSNANQDALAALEGRGAGTSLADELSEAADGDSDAAYRRLEAELKASKDQNKALTLYINKIIERLLQHQDFEHILDQSGDFKIPTGANVNKDLPPAPGGAAPSLLQRAKSMAISAGKPRPRPFSVMPGPSAHEDPDRAPSIPIGNLTRSGSTRRASRPMSEQFTGAGTNLVSQMYRGPEGPASPTLGNPRHSQTFFISQQQNPSAAARLPSGGAASVASAGNFPGMRSETSSTSGDSADVSAPSSQTTSPPRGQHHVEKPTTFAGNKPRPLRLVQEAEAVKTDTANKRSSWMGWASGWGKKEGNPAEQPLPATPTSETIPEHREP
ncbi:hypothetical protein B0T11DRAFT_319905 [Plectosphaerella cucumerina]|uniref:M protein, serotype 2.1 n=1 Tax=Plectosphaerella cucumerina TaxID=40658 RepID=A0A8K0TBN8_9PEZI|nr:hypothetical protein B0T11DRAFT_319905 [Plectosphaerella cucumerina]